MTIQKLFCKIMLRSFVLILGLISVTELSANPEFAYSASSLESSVTAPQGGGNVKMTGRVLDETKAGVPGATVIVKGSTRGVITGNDGTFSIDVKPTDVIEISYLGYETQSIPVGTKTNIVTELVRKVMSVWRETKMNDFYASGTLRADGRYVHDMYLMEVKKPSESTKPWDYYKVVKKIPGEQIFTTKAESKCALWK